VRYKVTVAGRVYEIEVDHGHLVRVNGHAVYVDLEQVGSLPIYAIALDSSAFVAFVEEVDGTYRVEVAGGVYPTEVQVVRPTLPPRKTACPKGENGCLVVAAPLPGRLVALPVAEGEWVESGQTVAIVESMKMQMELSAPRSGVVDTVHGKPGRDVAQEEALVTVQGDLLSKPLPSADHGPEGNRSS
jgi:biotin carboxyl carrier protein